MLRVAASRVPPLALRLREGAHYFQAWAHLLWGGGLVNHTTPGQGQGPGRMGCMVLIRTFHTTPEQGQGRTPGTFSGPEEWIWYPFFRS